MSTCKLWPGSRDTKGYGIVVIGRRRLGAHRVALEEKLGRRLLPGELALHSCDNPACVSPEHLRSGTAAERNRQIRERRALEAKR